MVLGKGLDSPRIGLGASLNPYVWVDYIRNLSRECLR